MNVKLHVLCIAVFVMLATVSNAQIFADSVTNSSGVTNPDNAVSKNDSDYALINTTVGINNSSTLTVGFSQHGLVGMTCGFTLQQDNGLISADVLNSISITLYDSKNRQIATKSGFSLSDVDILEGTGNVYTYRLYVRVNRSTYDVGYAKIKIGGLLTVNNVVRIYNGLLKFECPNFDADSLTSYANVTNPQNVISDSKSDYALLTPPLLFGTSSLNVHLPNVQNKTASVVFTFGQGNSIITTSLLTNLNASVYDFSGNILASDTVQTTADITYLDSGKFSLTVRVPANAINQIAGARIDFSGLANLLTTLKVYGVYIKSGTASAIKPTITPNGGTICNGQSLYLRARTQSSDITWQWYYNNAVIRNATRVRYEATKPGSYFVVTKQGSCSGIAPQVFIKQGNCIDDATAAASITASVVLKTYPNPFTSYTILSLKDIKVKSVVTVTDKSSNTIQVIHAAAGVELKLLQGKAPGLYFINVITEEGKTYSTKVLKQ